MASKKWYKEALFAPEFRARSCLQADCAERRLCFVLQRSSVLLALKKPGLSLEKFCLTVLNWGKIFHFLFTACFVLYFSFSLSLPFLLISCSSFSFLPLSLLFRCSPPLVLRRCGIPCSEKQAQCERHVLFQCGSFKKGAWFGGKDTGQIGQTEVKRGF